MSIQPQSTASTTLRSAAGDSTSRKKVRVFGYGSVEQAHPLDTAPDDLPPVTVWHTADAMYFYGEGDERTVPSTSSSIINYRNHYSRGSNYFLTASLPGITIGDTLCTAQTTPVETHLSIDLRHPEEVNFHSAGVFFFSQDLTTLRNGYTFTFSAPDFAGYANRPTATPISTAKTQPEHSRHIFRAGHPFGIHPCHPQEQYHRQPPLLTLHS